LVIGEDLVDAQGHIGELVKISLPKQARQRYEVTYKQRALNGVTLATTNTPDTKEKGAGDSNANQDSVDITELREGCDSPEEVDGTRNDRGRGDQQSDLQGDN
jgi:hypothetical protein